MKISIETEDEVEYLRLTAEGDAEEHQLRNTFPRDRFDLYRKDTHQIVQVRLHGRSKLINTELLELRAKRDELNAEISRLASHAGEKPDPNIKPPAYVKTNHGP